MTAFDVTGLAQWSPAQWIAGRLTTTFGAVTTHVPTGFDRYARIFHPADPGGEENITWSTVAQRRGTVMHPTAQFQALAPHGTTGGRDVQNPQLGNLAAPELRALAAVLRRHTETPEDCVFAFWEGWAARGRPTRTTAYTAGQAHVRVIPPLPPAAVTPAPVGRLALPHREYALFRGDLELVDRFGNWIDETYLSVQSPNLLWPADRAWFVATEVDFDSTLVGGRSSLITDLLREPALETAEVEPNDELHSQGDAINQ